METNEIENRKTIQKITETKRWFFDIYIIDKLARLTNKKKRHKLLVSETRGDITTDSIAIKKNNKAIL